MAHTLSPENLASIKKSYFSLLSHLLKEKSIPSDQVSCLLKWAVLLEISPQELVSIGKSLTPGTLALPTDKLDKLESIYHLVYMIYLDNVVEDTELAVASIYAEKLGFKPGLVGDLFKSIATAAYDNASPADVHKEVIDFLKIHNG